MTNNTIEVLDVAPGELREFDGQPRVMRSDARFRELVDDVAVNGVRTRLICRRLACGALQVLAGHRRRAAAIACGLLMVPVEVRVYDDRAALIFVCAENFGRCDLRHSEEVAACVLLAGRLAFSVGEIAKVTGHSDGWVQLRLDLPGLGDGVMAALDQGRMPLRVAEELLRVPSDARGEAVQLVFDKAVVGEVMSPAHAVRLIEESFLRPVRLAAEWERMVRLVVRQWGDLVSVCPVKERGEYVEPWGELVRGWVNVEEELPNDEVTSEWLGLSWRDLAVDLKCPMVLVPELAGETVKGILMLCSSARVRELAAVRAENGGGKVFVSPAQARGRREVKAAAEVQPAEMSVNGGWRVAWGEVEPLEFEELVRGGLEELLMVVAPVLKRGAAVMMITREGGES